MATRSRLFKAGSQNTWSVVSWRNAGVFSVTLVALLAGVYLLGNVESNVETRYGRRREGKSVNGSGVLAGLFERAGHQVISRATLSPAMERAQTIVWIPDDFAPPTRLQSEFLEKWLSSGADRTVIYVGRDFDAGPEYWEKIEPRVDPALLPETRRRWAQAQAAYDYERVGAADKVEAQWFTTQRSVAQGKTGDLAGPWTEGLELENTAIVVGHNLLPESSGDRYRVEQLLSVDEKPFITRLQASHWPDSQVILISNGSFLLNLPLVNSEHRKLAGRLVSQCQQGLCVFLETGPGGPGIDNRESRTPGLTGFEVLTVWPISPIVIHLVALGLLACFLMFPIFGNPRTLAEEDASDFGEHVQALGDLLYRVNDKTHARRQINAYRKMVHGESAPEFESTSEVAGGTDDAYQEGQATVSESSARSGSTAAEMALEQAQQAVQTAQRAGYNLDFTIQSLQTVDKIIREIGNSKTVISTASDQVFQLGCYAGETMRRFHGGDWHHPDESDLYRMIGPYMLVVVSSVAAVKESRPQILNPIGKALNMLENDSAGTLVSYHEMVQRSNTSESNTTRPL